MPETINIHPKDMVIARAILGRYVPHDEVWAFGSRVTGTAKEHSDLDLAIITHQPLPAELWVDLKEAFTESDLSIKVDVVDWAKTTEAFRELIKKKYVVIRKADEKNDGLKRSDRK
jgi:predicted nucleotidyltransferase